MILQVRRMERPGCVVAGGGEEADRVWGATVAEAGADDAVWSSAMGIDCPLVACLLAVRFRLTTIDLHRERERRAAVKKQRTAGRARASTK